MAEDKNITNVRKEMAAKQNKEKKMLTLNAVDI